MFDFVNDMSQECTLLEFFHLPFETNVHFGMGYGLMQKSVIVME